MPRNIKLNCNFFCAWSKTSKIEIQVPTLCFAICCCCMYLVEIKETVIMFYMQNLSNFSISSIVSSSCSVSILGTLLESNAVVARNEVGR